MTQPSATEDDLQELYRELILDHARSPRHFGQLAGATHSAEGINPLCGDKLSLYLQVDNDKRIKASSFEGSGCAISVASASLLTVTVTGLSVEEADSVVTTVTGRLTRGGDDDEAFSDVATTMPKLRALDGVRAFPSRVKCATLAWHALHSALHGTAAPASSE